MSQMLEYIQVSHNDLDGAGCSIVLESKFHIEMCIHSNYNEIVINLGIVDASITPHTKAVFVTDLNFDANAFSKLISVARTHPQVKFVYVDHHPYEGELGILLDKVREEKNISVHHTVTKCATKICYDMIKSDDKVLGKLVNYINAYDIWLRDTPLFETGWLLNTVFWDLKMSGFKYNINQNNYEIPKFFIKMYDDLLTDKDKMYKQMEKNNLFMIDEEDKIMVAFSDKYKAFFQIDFPAYKVYILPYLNSNNFSIRIDEKLVPRAEELKTAILDLVAPYDYLISAGGHPFAFGITIDKKAPKDDIISFTQQFMELTKQYI